MAEKIVQIYKDKEHLHKEYPITVPEAIKMPDGRTLALDLEQEKQKLEAEVDSRIGAKIEDYDREFNSKESARDAATQIISQEAAKLTDLEREVTDLERKADNISAEEAESEVDEIVIEDKDGNEVAKINAEGADFKNLKSNGESVLTDFDVAEIKEKVEDIDATKSEAEEEEQVWGNDEETEDYVKIGSYGIKAKAYLGLNGQPISAQNELFGLNVLCVGDSITQGQGLSVSDRWNEVLARKYGWNLVVRAQGGAPLSNYNKTQTAICEFIDYIATMTTKPDIVIVWGGHNDTGYRAAPFGDFEDSSCDNSSAALPTSKANRESFCGALRYIGECVHHFAPNAKLFYLTLLHAGGNNPIQKVMLNNTTELYKVSDAVEQASRMYSAKCINMGGCGINAVNGVAGQLTQDGVHPNLLGTKQIVNYLEKELSKEFVKF